MIDLFLKKVFKFCLLFALSVIIILIGSSFLVNKQMNFKLAPNIETLILGDSHTQCAIDDKILLNAMNMSESADTYFYSYVKLKKITAQNPQIKKLILGYGNHNVSINQDRWMQNESITGFKLPLHFFMFEIEDIKNYFVWNPFQIPKNALQIIKTNGIQGVKTVLKKPLNQFGIGGFLALEKPSANNETSDNKNIIYTKTEFSKIDLLNLKKIYAFCEEKKIKIILINTPSLKEITPMEQAFEKYLVIYKNENVQNGIILDHSKMFQEKIYFADNSHLNKNGAIQYTNYLNSISK